jgi:nucleotide-binding universal stress UspA family protein
MPARVDSRFGSIFEEKCDLLVIPSSVDGTLTPEVQKAVQEARLPFPSAMIRGEVMVLPSANPKYEAVAYAATAAEQTSSDFLLHGIGRTLGVIAAGREARKISAPVLGAGSGVLSAALAAAALARGFRETAPESAELWISVRDPEKFIAVTARLLGVVPPEAHTADPKSPTAASAPAAGQHVSSGHSHSDEVVSAVPQVVFPQANERGTRTTSPTLDTKPRKGVFISYSHADRIWLDRLQKHLKPLQREGVEVWDDTRLKAGEQWREEIREALAKAKVAILLISADFLASDFIVTNELPPLLKAAEEDGATILPIIASASRFLRIESLARFQAVNDPAKPLVQMSHGNREKVFDQVACAVEDALKR